MWFRWQRSAALANINLWCDHRAKANPRRSTKQPTGEAWKPSNGVVACTPRSGFFQVAALARNNLSKRSAFSRPSNMRHGCRNPVWHHRPGKRKRSICAKWATSGSERSPGGLPPQNFLTRSSTVSGVARKGDRRIRHLDQIAGTPHPMAEKLGLKPGIPIPVGAFDAHGTRSVLLSPPTTW